MAKSHGSAEPGSNANSGEPLVFALTGKLDPTLIRQSYCLLEQLLKDMRIVRFGGTDKQRGFRGVLVMIEKSLERGAVPREIINLPALLSFDGISGVYPCVVRDISVFGACLSTPYYMFANDFDLSFSGFQRTFACRVVWRQAPLSGVAFVLRRHAPKPVQRSSLQASFSLVGPMRPRRCGRSGSTFICRNERGGRSAGRLA